MDIAEILARLGSLKPMANELGVPESDAQRGAEALLPAILGGFKTQANAHPAGVDGLHGLLSQLGGGGVLDQVLEPQLNNASQGNEVLAEIFGSREVSRTVAGQAATKSGLSADLLKQMLPMLAMLVAGFLARQQRSAGGAHASGGLGGILGGLMGVRSDAGQGNSLTSILDMNGDGNALDDILRIAGKALR